MNGIMFSEAATHWNTVESCRTTIEKYLSWACHGAVLLSLIYLHVDDLVYKRTLLFSKFLAVQDWHVNSQCSTYD